MNQMEEKSEDGSGWEEKEEGWECRKTDNRGSFILCIGFEEVRV